MAKVTKKSKKTSAKIEKQELPMIDPAPSHAPPIPEGMINVTFSEADLLTFANFMNICGKTFEDLAVKSMQENSEMLPVFQARMQLSVAFATKLAAYVQMPEPVSREIH